jgi:hypothetical protein
MSLYLIAEFREKERVAAAIRSLRASGIAPSDLDLFSEEPVELPRGVLDRPSRMSLVSVLGAIVVGGVATAFIRWTQHDYRLVTGGMPIFSFWATGVITFEMTMLGAIVSAFGWFLWESGLLRGREGNAPVPAVGPGSLCLRVRCSGNVAAPAIDTLHRSGAVEVQRRGEA